MFIIIWGVCHATRLKSSKLETIVHLLVLLGHILGEEFLGVVKKNCMIGCKDEGLGHSLQILKLWEGLLISLERFIENLEILNLKVLMKFLKSFKMLLKLIIIQRQSSIVSLDRLARIETSRLFGNIIEISDKVKKRLNFFLGSSKQIGIETNKLAPVLFNICNQPNRLNIVGLVHMLLKILKAFHEIKILILKIGAVLLETLVQNEFSPTRAS